MLSDAILEFLEWLATTSRHQVEGHERFVRQEVSRAVGKREPLTAKALAICENVHEARRPVAHPVPEQVMVLVRRRGRFVTSASHRKYFAVDASGGHAGAVEFFLHDDRVVPVPDLLQTNAGLAIGNAMIAGTETRVGQMADRAVCRMAENLAGFHFASD